MTEQPRYARGGYVSAHMVLPAMDLAWDHRSVGDQVMVPVGMSDLLDDWQLSPDAARWEPDRAVDPDAYVDVFQRYVLGVWEDVGFG